MTYGIDIGTTSVSGVGYEFLKYHEYGKGKWRTPCAVTNGFVSSEQIGRFVAATGCAENVLE